MTGKQLLTALIMIGITAALIFVLNRAVMLIEDTNVLKIGFLAVYTNL